DAPRHDLHSFPTRRSSDLVTPAQNFSGEQATVQWTVQNSGASVWAGTHYWVDQVYLSPDPTFIASRATSLGGFVHDNTVPLGARSEEHTSELQSLAYLVCR